MPLVPEVWGKIDERMHMKVEPGTISQRSGGRILGSVGKLVRGDLYFHFSEIRNVAEDYRSAMLKAAQLAGCQPGADFNVIKIGRDQATVSLLSYKSFFEDAFPRLEKVWTVDLSSGKYRERNYRMRGNPPILHKKELLLSGDDPSRPLFEALTDALERKNIRPDRPGLGFLRQWEEYLANMGIGVLEHRIVDVVR